MLAVTAYDDTVLPLIEDNEKHDLAYIYTMVVTAIGQDVAYDASYCDGLRGNYDSEYPEDADLNAALCLDAVNLVSAVQALDEEELDEFIDDLRTALEAPNADEALTDLLHRLLEDEDGSEQQIIIEQGERWCYQDSSNIGTCSQMIWVVYDPVTNTLNEVFEYVGNNTYETSRERERRSLVDGEVVVETYVVVIQMIVVNERLIERHNIFPSGRIDIDIFTLDY